MKPKSTRSSGESKGKSNRSHVRPPELGLVVQTIGPEVRFKTITRARLLAKGPDEQSLSLKEIYSENLRRLEGAVRFCVENEIRLYRVPSNLFPFLDTPAGAKCLERLRDECKRVGRLFIENQIRVVAHPEPYVVLNSEKPQVIENSRKILGAQALMMDALDQPRSPWSILELHGGKSGRAQELVDEIKRLPENVRSRIALENDESAYGADEILEICRQAKVPMVFDAHHHVIHEGAESYEDTGVSEMTRAARETWPDPSWQLVHMSNGRNGFLDPHHSDLIETMPTAFEDVPWIEIEAKTKEAAIRHLRSTWPPVCLA